MRRWFGLLVAVGLLSGTILDERPRREVAMRAGLRVIEADFHAHTRFSDGFLSPFDLVLQAERRGLDAFAVTEHNVVFPALMARAFSRTTNGPVVLVGEEITTRGYHVHGIGLFRRVDPYLPLDALIEEVHDQGGVVIAAHPVREQWAALLPVRDRIDGSEVMHPRAYAGRDERRWRWEDMRDYWLDARAAGARLAAIGSSDYHFFSPMGVCRTLVFVDPDRFARGGEEAERAVVDAIRLGRTVVHDTDGRAYGDPELVAILEREPYEPRPQDYRYRGGSLLDLAGRAAALVGLFGLILAAPRKRADPA